MPTPNPNPSPTPNPPPHPNQARALEKLPDADTCTKLEEFVRATLKGGKLADKYAAVCAEGAGPADAEL